MGQIAHPPDYTIDTSAARQRFDRKILILFAVLATLTIGISALFYLITEGATTFDLASSALSSLSLTFLVVGVPVYIRNWKRGLASQKRILRILAILSVVMTVVSLVGTVLASIYVPDVVVFEKMSIGELLLAGAFMAVTLFITFVAMCYVAFVAALGIVGVVVALERSVTPWILGQVVSLSETKKLSLARRTIRWLFDLPDVLDTRTLSLKPTEPRKRVLLSDLKAPVMWQLIFGFVLGIYISFNPFVSDRSPGALLSMFTLLATASTLFPFLILPWFIFRRLGASIRGQTKHFTLFDGIRSRVFRSYFAVGTIVIIIRLSIQEIAVAFETYLAAFAAFMAAVLVSALLSTFVYMNYFENDLAKDVVEEAKEIDVLVVD